MKARNRIAAFAICFVTSTFSTRAQESVDPPNGETIEGSWFIEVDAVSGASADGSFTSHGVYQSDVAESPNYLFAGNFYRKVWGPPPGRFIVDVGTKVGTFKNGYAQSLLVLLDNGDIYSVDPLGSGFSQRFGHVATVTSESFKKVIGDAVYALTSSFVYVSRDSGSSFAIDSLGLNGGSARDIAIDSSQFVYAATSKGLVLQHPDSSVWHPLGPAGAYTSVFVDRRNWVHAGYVVSGTGRGVATSTDNGATWNVDSAGIGTTQIQRLDDDGRGFVYALGNSGGNLYRRRANGTGWTRIDAGLKSFLGLQPNAGFIHAVGGDSVLQAATAYGAYVSVDSGETWLDANRGIRAENIWSVVRGSSGRLLATTNFGMYSIDPGDTAWVRRYPASGFRASLPLYGSGSTIFTQGIGANPNTAQPLIKSSDNGTTWNDDSSGIYRVNAGVVTVDENGTEHLATSQYGSSFFALLWQKTSAGSWTLDTTNFVSTNQSYSSSIVSDGHGFLYVSGSYGAGTKNARVIRRPIAGGAWTPDTAGLGPAVTTFTRLVADKNGVLYGSTGSALYRKSGGVWSKVALPSQLSFPSIGAVSFDSSNALFASFRALDIHFVSVSGGVYFTTDTGTTWTYAGLDSATINGLASYGDTTYAFGSTITALTRHAFGTGVVLFAPYTPEEYTLEQNYPNPFNPTTVVRFHAPGAGPLTLRVFDLLGREVAVLERGLITAGAHEVAWNASGMTSGVYFVRLEAAGQVRTRKLLLLK